MSTVQFQAIQISICTEILVYTQLNNQPVLFQTIQFRTSTKLNGSNIAIYN